ncbi:MAG: hypothetical protein AUH99_10755 [Candidatus Rokubacteria bacterium 13_2_20CM_2_70_11]|nr:MAG: hypothetical protein AUH99_10755 [Candidatus Rokubacteria bacterium 13_2_20CM_2_70_11]
MDARRGPRAPSRHRSPRGPHGVSDARLLSVLIPAVGGQGGGVLLEWIVDAALAGGLQVHGTSIPGVAQRTGSTTYYVEVFTAGDGDAEPPTFSLYPVPGALDVLLAPEFLEIGRMIELGFPSPDRTTIIASTHRLYSIHEKITTGRGVYPIENLQAAARAFSKTLYAFDALALAREHGTEANAVLLGALAGSGVLPIRVDAYRDAIRAKGVQVATADPDFERRIAEFPEELRPTLAQAVARLVDYQDRRYAERYLGRLTPFARDPEVARVVARHLAVWMTYEDAIRVAQLKTRPSRFERIRQEKGAQRGEIVVTDFLKPDLDEIYGILPYRLVAPFARWAERRWPHGRPALGQHVKTTTVLGYLRVWLLTLLRPLRPISYRAHAEHARMHRWLAAVARCASWDKALALEIARGAQLVKGYGDVRRRMTAHVDRLLESVMRAAECEAANGGGFEASRELAARYRTLVLQGPDAEARAVALADRVLARLTAADRRGALASLAEA